MSRREALQPILESHSGIHLTAYLSNTQVANDISQQIRDLINEVTDNLQEVISEVELQQLIKPIQSISQDPRVLSFTDGSLGLFRTKDSFRLLKIPLPIEKQVHIASTFHVKPLIQWIQIDQEFLLLSVQRDQAALYVANQLSLKKIASISISDLCEQGAIEEVALGDLVCRWAEDAAFGLALKMYLICYPDLSDQIKSGIRYKKFVHSPSFNADHADSVKLAVREIRRVLKNEAKIVLSKQIMEFKKAEQQNLAKKNIFQISKAAIQGKVRKLIIAEEVNIFGKIDPTTGGLAIHPIDLDHEDDDILDDLAQAVLLSGGQVMTAKQQDIPSGRPILALLNEDGETLNSTAHMEVKLVNNNTNQEIKNDAINSL